MSTPQDGNRGDHDRQEPSHHEALGRRSLAASFKRYDALEVPAESLKIRQGSSLAGDRSSTPYSPVPDQVRSGLGVAMDHLHAFKIIVVDGQAALPFALYTLVRSAYEAVGTALWLLQPSSRDERVLRSLKLAHHNRRLAHVLKEGLNLEDAGWDRNIAALERDRDGREQLVGADLRNVGSVTKRLGAIGELMPDLFMPPLALWQTSSGMAHANQSMMLFMLDREQIGEPEHGGADYRMTTSIILLAGYYDAALDMVERLLEAWNQRN